MRHALAAGWLVGALVNALFIVSVTPSATKLSTRLQHHLFDLGHFAALGLLTALAHWLWMRAGAKAARWSLVAITGAAIGVGALVLPENLDNFASRMGGPIGLTKAAGVVAVAASIPAAHIVGKRLRRLSSVLPSLALAMGLFALNNLVAKGGYEVVEREEAHRQRQAR